MELELTIDRRPPITSQMHHQLCHKASGCTISTAHVLQLYIFGLPCIHTSLAYPVSTHLGLPCIHTFRLTLYPHIFGLPCIHTFLAYPVSTHFWLTLYPHILCVCCFRH